MHFAICKFIWKIHQRYAHKISHTFNMLLLPRKKEACKNVILAGKDSMCNLYYFSNYRGLNRHCKGPRRVDGLKLFIWDLHYIWNIAWLWTHCQAFLFIPVSICTLLMFRPVDLPVSLCSFDSLTEASLLQLSGCSKSKEDQQPKISLSRFPLLPFLKLNFFFLR